MREKRNAAVTGCRDGWRGAGGRGHVRKGGVSAAARGNIRL